MIRDDDCRSVNLAAADRFIFFSGYHVKEALLLWQQPLDGAHARLHASLLPSAEYTSVSLRTPLWSVACLCSNHKW